MGYELKKQCGATSVAMQMFYQIISVKREHIWRKKLLTYESILKPSPMDLGETTRRRLRIQVD